MIDHGSAEFSTTIAQESAIGSNRRRDLARHPLRAFDSSFTHSIPVTLP